MTVITSMYDGMDKIHQENMIENQEHIANMLDFAIQQLVEFAEDQEVFLVDNCNVCQTYDEIFNCLKHWSQKRMQKQ